MDVKNSMEVLQVLVDIVNDAKDAKAGGIDAFEAAKIALGNASGLYAAGADADLIVPELKDLDRAERDLLADKALELMRAVVAFYQAPK